MKMRACLLLALLAHAAPAPAVSITLVYQDPLDAFFDATTQATLNKAAADLSFAITTVLGPTQNVYNGTNGSTTATVDWSLNYLDPTNGATTVTLSNAAVGANTIVFYVGSRNLGSTLGQGGPGGAEYSVTGSGFPAEWAGAVDNMEAASNAGMVRGGPVLGTFSGAVSGAPYDLDYGYSIGTLAINNTATWNKDYTQNPTASQNDLYSVAIHEMVHALGFGVGPTWNEQVDGINWNGPAVMALLDNDGTGVLNEDGQHIAEGLMGTPLVNGVFQIGQSQEALMDPTLLIGTRKYITDLDLAFLQDMGWEVQAVPEPSAGLLILAGSSAGLFLRGRKRQVAAG